MRLGLALLAAVCLCASSPPAWFPGGGMLVAAGWGAFFALVTGEGAKRRNRTAYLVGVCHMLWFSSSLRHILLPAYLAIGAVGGLYYVLAGWWTRALSRFVPRPVAFGCAVAGTCWLRAHFVEIQYPHVQPAHCLYEWPVLLGGLRWSGEEGVNFLLAALAAGVVDLYRAWRVGRPGYRRSATVLGATVAAYLAGSFPLPPAAAPRAGDRAERMRTVRMLLFEPRLRPFRPGSERAQQVIQRVVRPTLAAAGPRAADPPDLVVWPESVAVHAVTGSSDSPVVHPVPAQVPWSELAPRTRLLEGALLQGTDGVPKVLALLVDHRGRYLGHHEKQNVVPGGEHQPFLGFLPKAWSARFRAWFEEAMGVPLPETTAGAPRDPLETAAGVRFGAMVCYDNAFPGPAEELSRRGAAFLVVLSNESWYLGGGELWQMHAMTVCRALEVGLPIVRCTVDGATIVVDAAGRLREALPYPPPDYGSGAKLRVDLRVPASGEGTVPPLRRPLTWGVLLSLLSLLAPLLGSWGRIERAGSSAEPAAPPDPHSPVSGP